MSSHAIDVKVTGAVGTIVLNRPQRRNALTRAMLAQLAEALSDLHLEKRVRAIVLTGAGSAFCAGMDVHEMHAAATLPDAEKTQDWGDTAEAYCELVVADDSVTEADHRLGQRPGRGRRGGPRTGVRHRRCQPCRPIRPARTSPRHRGRRGRPAAGIPRGRRHRCPAARLLVALPRRRGPPTWHLSRADRRSRLWARCAQIGEECAAGAPEAVQLTKRLLYETVGEQLATQLTVGAAMSATARTTEAAQEGLTAFVEKRKPEWK